MKAIDIITLLPIIVGGLSAVRQLVPFVKAPSSDEETALRAHRRGAVGSGK